jgi:hypothetical protein
MVVMNMDISFSLMNHILFMILLFFDQFASHHYIIPQSQNLMMLYTMPYHLPPYQMLLMMLYEFENNPLLRESSISSLNEDSTTHLSLLLMSW